MDRPRTRRLDLGHGRVVLVDDADLDMLRQFKWLPVRRGQTYYARSRFGGATIYMHRLLLLPDPDQSVDHKNGNGLDNRRANLRVADACGQARNSRKGGGVSRFRGVYLNRNTGRWYAQVSIRDRSIHLGTFDSEEEAALARDAAARVHYGEFGRFNFEADGVTS